MVNKVCKCGREYRGQEEFMVLCEFKGEWLGLLLGNCVCGSTIAVEKYPGANQEAIQAMKKNKVSQVVTV